MEERRVLALVADSVAEFSGVQGQNNWEYLRATPSAGSTPTLTALTPLTWNGTNWVGPGSFNTPLLTAAGGHPSDANQWAVRRYTSEVTGLVTLSGTLQHTQVGGSDGTYGRLYLNNSQFFAQATPQNLSVAGPIYNYSATTYIKAGETIDLAIDDRGNFNSDNTNFNLQVNTITNRGVIADSYRDFSNVQGSPDFSKTGSWSYGHYATPVTPASFTTAGWAYTTRWERSAGSFQLLTAQGGHPDGSLSVVKRWTSGLSGNVVLDGFARRNNEDPSLNVGGSDGILVRIFQNGVEKLNLPLDAFLSLNGTDDLRNVNTSGFSLPLTVAVGDTLDFVVDSDGPRAGAGNSYDGFEFIATISSTDQIIPGTSGNDTLVVRQNGAALQYILNGGTPVDITGSTSLKFNGLDGNDKLVVDYTGGIFNLPVSFDGHGPTTSPGDSLEILGGAWNTVTYNHTNGNSGTVSLDVDGAGGVAPSVITFTGIEPITNTGTADNIIFNLPANAQGVLEDDGVAANGLTRLRSTNAAFEQTTFANPANSLTINGGGANIIAFQSPDAGFSPTKISVAGAASDLFRLGASNVIPNATTLEVTTAQFQFNSFSETFAAYLQNSGTVITNGGNHDIVVTGAFVVNGGMFTVNSGTQISANSVTFTGPGSGLMGGNTAVRETRLTVGGGGITLNGATVTINQGQVAGALPGRIVLNGNLTTTGTSNLVVGSMTSPTSQPQLDLQAATRTFNVTGTFNLSVATINGNVNKTGTGNLALNRTGGDAITGNVDVQSGRLTLSQSEQLANTASLTVSGTGTLCFNNLNETIANYTQTTSQGLVDSGGALNGGNGGQVVVTGTTTLTAGGWQINSGGKWTSNSFVIANITAAIFGNVTTVQTELVVGAGGLTMTGATINLNLGTLASTLGSRVTLNGNVTTNASATPSRIQRVAGGTLGTTDVSLGGGTRVFNIADGAAADDLVLGTVNLTNGGLTKTGAGNLRYEGSVAHTYAGLTTVAAGRLTLAKSSNNTAIPQDVTITGGTLQVDTDGQFGGTTTDIVVNGGTFDLRGSGYRGTAASLSFLAGTVTDGDGTINSQINLSANSPAAVLIRGGLTIPINLALDTSSLSGLTFDATNNGTATISGTLTIANGNKSITVNNGAADVDLNISGVVNHYPGASTLGFSKQGAGTLQLSGNNSFNGITNILAGTVLATNANALGQAANGTVIATGATLLIDGGLTIAEPIIVTGVGADGAGAIQHRNGAATLAGQIDLGGHTTLNNLSGTLNVTGTMNLGVSNLTVAGAAMTISGAIISPASYVAAVLNDAPLNYWRLHETTGTFLADATGHNAGTLSGSAVLAQPGPILSDPTSQAIDFTGGSAALPMFAGVQGSYTVEFWIQPDTRTNYNQGLGNPSGWGAFVFHTTSDGSIYTGNNVDSNGRFTPTELPPNTLQLGQWQQFTITFDNTLATNNAKVYKNGVLIAQKQLSTGSAILSAMNINTSVDGRVSDVAVYNRALSAGQVATHYALSQSIVTAGSQLIVSGAVTLVGNNSYTGNTTVQAGGVLKTASDNVIPDGAGFGTVIVEGTLDLDVFNETINGLSGNGQVVRTGSAAIPPTLTIGDANSTVFDGTISGVGNVTKQGAGTLTLNGANTYTGPTQVNAGALGGSGSLTSDITVANLATLSPGGTPGTLTTTGNTTLQNGSIYRVELIGLTNDRLVTNGVDLTDAVLDASSDSNLGAGTPFVIIDNTSGAQVIGTFAGLPENASFFINGYQYFITYVYNGNDVAIIRNQMVDAINDQFGPILVNTSFTGNTYTNDSDPDLDAHSTVIAQALNGKVFMDPATGQFTYTPKPNFIGTDSFTYRLSDGEFNDTATVEIIVAPVILTGGVLQVGGTTGGDNILVQAGSIRYNNTTYPHSASKVVVHGGGGNDTISVTASNIAVEFYGDDGDDYLSGGSLNDILDGGAGTDRLLGNAGDDNLYGGGGSDNLSGGVGNDYLSGDGYLDASSLEQQATDAGKDTLSGDAGDDEIHGGAGMDTLLGGIGNDYLSGGDDGDAVDGGAGHDILLGGGGGDKLYGRAGNDVLIGGAGLDTLLGDTGLDLVYGGDVTASLSEATLRAIALQWFTPATQTAAVNQLLGYKQDDLVSDTLNGEADDDWYLLFAKDLIATTERFPGNRKTQL